MRDLYKEKEELFDILRNNGYLNREHDSKEDKEVLAKIKEIDTEIEIQRLREQGSWHYAGRKPIYELRPI